MHVMSMGVSQVETLYTTERNLQSIFAVQGLIGTSVAVGTAMYGKEPSDAIHA